MLLNNKIKVKIRKTNFEYFKNLGYECNLKDVIYILPKHLTKGSHTIIDVICDYCGDEHHIQFRDYIKQISVCNKYSCNKKDCSNQKIKDVCIIKYGVNNPFQAEFVKEKSKNTLKKKYGVEHQMELQFVKNKIKKTCLERYGVNNPMKSDIVKQKIKLVNLKKYGVVHESKLESQQLKRKNTRIKNGNQFPDDMIEPYQLYRKQVKNISNKLKIDLLDNWDGYDYYDGEYIKNNFKLNYTDKNYPTLDHKISVFYGFKNNINVNDIANIKNLCFTKNKINAQKCKLNENEYRLKIKSII